ncbi:MAG: hypothetical protein ABUS57_05855 [Pseudomonadota bacterium]
MRAFCSILALSFAFASANAFAQDNGADMMAQMQASQAAATAQAARPGDDQLTCDDLQAEMTTTMNDPAVRAQMAQMGAWAESQQQRGSQAMSQARGQMASNMVMGFASSFVPWLGYAQMAAQRAQVHQMQQQAQESQAQSAEMMTNMETVMPQLMRGQHLYELAQTKQCAFLQQTAPQAPAP